MSLTILSVAYPLAPVGPDAVGGAEQILNHIDHALIEAGHRSLIVACEGSKPWGQLISTGPLPSQLTEEAHQAASARTREAIECALRKYPIDLIHMHGIDFATYLPDTELPIMVTLHLPPSWYPAQIFRKNLLLHCVSAAQRRGCPADAKLLPDIPNGVPIPSEPPAEKEDYALSLGRICPEKGFHLGAEAANLAGIRFVLAGEVFGYEAHREYFDRELRGVDFIGPARGECKRRLLARARCVLIPSLVPETSSLVALEAMAAGTPVVAFPSGALADIVQDGKTGFLVNNVAEMAAAIARVDQIAPAGCRSYVAEHFSVARMTARYLDLYKTCKTTVPTCSSLRVQIVRDASSVPEWRNLYAASPTATPFQSPHWALCWWDSFGTGQFTLIAIRNGAELVGLAPLYIEGRTVRFLGASISDYGDVLAASGWERIVADSVMDALDSLSAEWDVCDFDELRSTSCLLIARIPARYEVTVQDSSICPRAELSDFVLSARQRRNLNNSHHRLEREFPAAVFETVGETLGGADVDTFIDAFIRLHEARWTPRAGSGVLVDEAVRQFHRAAIPRLHREGIARLYILRSGERILSALYCLVHRQTLYYYLGGFDPSIQQMGPGSLLIDYAIRQARLEGIQVIDFLRGAEAYKYLWGAVDHRNHRLLIRNG